MATKRKGELDLAFAMDCTGSMGSYISEARNNIVDIVNEVVKRENCEVRLALVEYRDHPPEDKTFITRKHDFTESADTMKLWLEECRADGGGDTPEAVADALNDVLYLTWREEATKICVFIADAPPHGLATEGCRDAFPKGCPDGLDPMDIAKELAGKGVSLYVVGCEPNVSVYKDFYLALADITGGQYVPHQDANSLKNIIIFGSIEEMSLKKFEAEVEEEIKVLTSSGIVINEEELSSSLHKRWKDRGEKTKQLKLNSKCLETAKNSANASMMAKMGFDGVQNVFATSLREAKKDSGKHDASKSDPGDIDSKIKADKVAVVTKALADLKIGQKSLSGSWVKVDSGDLAQTVDFGPAEGDQTSTSKKSIKVELGDLPQSVDFGPAEKEGPSTEEGSGYQCIDEGVTMSQTMRIIQKSMMKLSGSGKADKKLM